MLKKIVIIILISFTSLFAQTAMDFYNRGQKAFNEGNYNDALKYYEQSAESFKKTGDKGNYSSLLNSIGLVYSSWGQYDKAIDYYKKALGISEELGQKRSIAIRLNNIGDAYRFWEQYDKAIDYYKRALVISERLGEKRGVAICLNNIGLLYHSWGQYDKAIDYHTKSLDIFKELEANGDVAACLNNIGGIYNTWGQYDKAIDYYKKALTINEKYGQKMGIAFCLNNIGDVYSSWTQHDKAIDYYKRALDIFEELGLKGDVALCLNNIGDVYSSWGQYDKAIDHYKKALATNEALGQKGGIAIRLNNLGFVYSLLGQYYKAIDYYKKSLTINEALDRKGDIARDLNNIGAAFHSLKEYNKSIENLKKSVEILEQLRLTAPGEIKRDYLSKQIHTYQWLVSSYIRNADFINAINTVEISSAKYLIDQLGERLDEKKIKYVDIQNYRKKITENSAILSFSNVELGTGIASIIVDNKNINAFEADEKLFIKNIIGKYSTKITKTNEKLRGLKIKVQKKEKDEKDKTEITEFNKIINYYRSLLSQPKLGKEEADALKYIASELYNFLFKDIEKQLAGKEELTIMPGGTLAFIPFESLIMPDGRYLIEKYNIKYTQSLTVMEIIEKRNYSNTRKPMIAFGGGIYDEITYKKDMVETEQQLAILKKGTLLAVNRGQSTRDAYFSLGFGQWDNLPGTLTEVKAIKTIVKDMDLYTGKDVDESVIKSLSKKGNLKDYKVLHFAIHGLVVPEMPELSALVLSQYKNEKNGEDGYLRMQEIAALDINADFVNLSACETGLGKIYGGEGVVGLTQSFLLAGANGLSVSLWQVADKSTMEFMIGMYKKVSENGMSYDKAITEMKREYIKSGKYSIPFYWAPFVFYGK